MEFKFPVTSLFNQDMVEINYALIPPGFRGDRRALLDTSGKVSEIVNAMGEASAAAQGLTTPITTADRLRNSEHKIYLLIDQHANHGRGAVTGMLKTGKKSLYLFDRNGQYYHVTPTCVLDFYVHESRQRMGLGKQLYEHMLQKEHVEPVEIAIDRPSEKFLGFLNKYYSLKEPVKQMNNYVVFDNFFGKIQEHNGTVETITSTSSPESCKKMSANGLQTHASPLGRYGAHKPTCSMGQIIHNQTSTIQKSSESTGPVCMPDIPNQSPLDKGSPNPVNNQSVSNNEKSQETFMQPYYNLQQSNYVPNNFLPYYNYANMLGYNFPQAINYLPPPQQTLQQQQFNPNLNQMSPMLPQQIINTNKSQSSPQLSNIEALNRYNLQTLPPHIQQSVPILTQLPPHLNPYQQIPIINERRQCGDYQVPQTQIESVQTKPIDERNQCGNCPRIEKSQHQLSIPDQKDSGDENRGQCRNENIQDQCNNINENMNNSNCNATGDINPAEDDQLRHGYPRQLN